MTDLTPTQEASRKMAEAVFGDPDLRAQFELMAKESAERVPVPDDFAWLLQTAESDKFSGFEDSARKLIRVPKSDKDAEGAKDR